MQQLRQGLPLALLICGVVFVLGIVGFFVYSWMSGSTDLGPLRPTQATQTESAQSDVDRWLGDARAAVAKDALVQPAGNNALELYLKVLDAEPENRTAKVALIELLPSAAQPTDRLIEEGEFDEAARVLALLEKAEPGSLRTAAMQQKLTAAQRNVEQVRLAEQERARNQALAAQQQAQAQNQPAATTPAALGATSDADVNPLSSNPARQPAAQRPPAASAQPPASTAQTTPPPARETTPAPSQASATPPASTAQASGPQNRKFELIKSVPPEYPARALRQRTEGWVELEFTVNVDGNTENVKVTNAQPRRGEFDREAIRAVQQWKFRPQITDGKPVSTVVRQRLNFTLR
jgi:protein TonB